MALTIGLHSYPAEPTCLHEFTYFDGSIVCLDDTMIQPVDGVLYAPPYKSSLIGYRKLTLDGKCIRAIDFDVKICIK